MNHRALSDHELLQAWVDGDKKGGRELYRRYHPIVVRFFFNKVDDETADLVQATFLAALEGAATFRGKGAFRSWLLTVAYRVMCRHFERRSRRDVPIGEMSVVDMGTSPSQKAARSEKHRFLLEALRKLPLSQQVAIELHYWEGMTSKEIVAATGWPMGTVQTRIQRARDRLAKMLASQTGTSALLLPDDVDAWVHRIRRTVLEQ